MLNSNCYMFRHQDAILRVFNKIKWSPFQLVLLVVAAVSTDRHLFVFRSESLQSACLCLGVSHSNLHVCPRPTNSCGSPGEFFLRVLGVVNIFGCWKSVNFMLFTKSTRWTQDRWLFFNSLMMAHWCRNV